MNAVKHNVNLDAFSFIFLEKPKRAARMCGFGLTLIVHSLSHSFLCSLFQNVHIRGVNKQTTLAFLSST